MPVGACVEDPGADESPVHDVVTRVRARVNATPKVRARTFMTRPLPL